MRCLDEFEDVLWGNCRNTPTKTTSVNSDQTVLLFIVGFQPFEFELLENDSGRDRTGDLAATDSSPKLT
jgi:hypothetical protein